MSPSDDLRALQARVEDLEATLRRLATDLEDLAVASLMPSGRSGGPTTTCYPDLDTWVRDYFAPLYARPIGGDFRWCPQWRDHVEAVARLEAMWRAWEALRLDGATGMANWFTTVADPLVHQLTNRGGPLGQCQNTRHEHANFLPVT